MARPTYFYHELIRTVRRLEVDNPSAFDGGMNQSNNTGVGIAMDADMPPVEDWTLNDQDTDPRQPQVSQYVGGTGYDAPSESTGSPGKGNIGITVGTPSATGDGVATDEGDANLIAATGWRDTVGGGGGGGGGIGPPNPPPHPDELP